MKQPLVRPYAIGALIVAVLVMVLLSFFSQGISAQSPHQVYLPLIVRDGSSAPVATPTPTLVPDATPTPTLTQVPDATPTPTPTVTPTVPPTSYDNCQTDPMPASWGDYPVQIISVDKYAEEVELENVSDSEVNLDGWHMCSFRGNQNHEIGGILSPGQIKIFPHTGENIWNNFEEDNGGLYNSDGQLVSYWSDN